MAGPIIRLFTMTIKPGKPEEARKHNAELVDFARRRTAHDRVPLRLRRGGQQADKSCRCIPTPRRWSSTSGQRQALDDGVRLPGVTVQRAVFAARSPKRSPASSRSGTERTSPRCGCRFTRAASPALTSGEARALTRQQRLRDGCRHARSQMVSWDLTWLKFADLGRTQSPDLRFPRADSVRVRTKRPPSRPLVLAPP